MMRMAMAAAVALGLSCAATAGATVRDHTGDEVTRPPAATAKRFAARSPAAGPGPIDADQDGRVELKEAQRYYGWLFSILDRDGDGVVAQAEFMQALGPARSSVDATRSAARRARVDSLFQRLDHNADRILDQTEFMRACDAHFASSDADGDGDVSADEFNNRQPL